MFTALECTGYTARLVLWQCPAQMTSCQDPTYPKLSAHAGDTWGCSLIFLDAFHSSFEVLAWPLLCTQLEWKTFCRFRIVNSLYSYVNRRRCVLIWIQDYANERWHIDLKCNHMSATRWQGFCHLCTWCWRYSPQSLPLDHFCVFSFKKVIYQHCSQKLK